MYDKRKIKIFNEDTIDDYNRNSVIKDIAKINQVEKTDKSFTQIGIRPILDDEMFISPNFDPRLPSAGRIVAIGERDYLIMNLLKNKKIKIIKIEKDELKNFPKYIEFNNAVILLSTNFYVEVFTKLMHRIDYEERYPRLDRRYKIIPVPKKVLKNKIIIIDKEAILWKKKLFDNKVTKKKETINIDIEPKTEGKVAITIRSVNKIKHIDSDLIKILEIEEKEE